MLTASIYEPIIHENSKIYTPLLIQKEFNSETYDLTDLTNLSSSYI